MPSTQTLTVSMSGTEIGASLACNGGKHGELG
jgi:hypothetical protein